MLGCGEERALRFGNRLDRVAQEAKRPVAIARTVFAHVKTRRKQEEEKKGDKGRCAAGSTERSITAYPIKLPSPPSKNRNTPVRSNNDKREGRKGREKERKKGKKRPLLDQEYEPAPSTAHHPRSHTPGQTPCKRNESNKASSVSSVEDQRSVADPKGLPYDEHRTYVVPQSRKDAQKRKC